MSYGRLWHVLKVNSILQTESGIVVDGEAVPLKKDVKEQLEWRKNMKELAECKEWTSVECKWSANLANKLPPISKMRMVDQMLIFFNNENLVVTYTLLQDKPNVDEGCLELLEKSQENMWSRIVEIDKLRLAKLKEEDAKRWQRKVQREVRNQENELRRKEEERKLMESRVKDRSARSLASKFEQGKVAFFAKDWGR